MPAVINFDKAKITMIAFTSREDFSETMFKLDALYNQAKKFPVFYIMTDKETKEEDLHRLQNFIVQKMKETSDIEMIKRNIDAGRFPEATG